MTLAPGRVPVETPFEGPPKGYFAWAWTRWFLLIQNSIDTFKAQILGLDSGVAAPYAISGLQVFASNADAITGGLTVGQLYRTGADPDTVCVVH